MALATALPTRAALAAREVIAVSRVLAARSPGSQATRPAFPAAILPVTGRDVPCGRARVPGWQAAARPGGPHDGTDRSAGAVIGLETRDPWWRLELERAGRARGQLAQERAGRSHRPHRLPPCPSSERAQARARPAGSPVEGAASQGRRSRRGVSLERFQMECIRCRDGCHDRNLDIDSAFRRHSAKAPGAAHRSSGRELPTAAARATLQHRCGNGATRTGALCRRRLRDPRAACQSHARSGECRVPRVCRAARLDPEDGWRHGDAARRPGSDVDVFVAGDVSFREAVDARATAAKATGRSVNPVVYAVEELRQRVAPPGHFVGRQWKGPKLWTKGCADALGELRASGMDRPASTEACGSRERAPNATVGLTRVV